MVESINATVPLEEARAALAAAYDLRFTKAVAKVTERLREKLGPRVTDETWPTIAPLIVQISRLKGDKGAAIFADFHQPAEVYWGVADHAGDELDLLREAGRLRRATIVVAGALPLAESIKLIAPRKRVFAADSRVTSQLSTSMTRDDLEAIRAQYPAAEVLAHIHASVAIKAAAQATFTAANALAVVESAGADQVIMVPDQHLAQHVAKVTKKKIVTWAGRSEEYGHVTSADIDELRAAHPGAQLLAHPQNPPAVTAVADFTGSAVALARWLGETRPAEAIVLGDRMLADNLATAVPETQIIAPNGTEPRHRATLEAILWSLHTMSEEVAIPADLAPPARAALQRMLDLARRS